MIEVNQIIQGDCLEVMKSIPDKSIDLVLTDPFYVPKKNFDWKMFDEFYWDFNKKWLLEVKRILKDDFHFIFSFSSEDMARFDLLLQDLGFNIQSRMVWNYRNSAKSTAANTKWAKTYEFIFHCSSGKKLNFPEDWDDRRFDVQTIAIPQSNFNEGKVHPFQKPIKLWQMLVEFASSPADLILDPFAGSGTTAVAAKMLGRRYIGIEISSDYCEISRRRLDNTAIQAELDLTK
jgi:DNA modification methylase